jgi:hypothetical protein
MKLFTVFFAAAILCPLPALMAQDATTVPVPDKETSALMGSGTANGTTSGTNSSTLGAEPTPLPLMPETPSSPTGKPRHAYGAGGSSATGADAAAQNLIKKNKTAENTEDIADRIKYREAKYRAMQDPNIQGLLDEANAAKKDLDKREAMRKYYKALCAKIVKIDGSIKKLASTRLDESLKFLDQSHVRPEEYREEASASH